MRTSTAAVRVLVLGAQFGGLTVLHRLARRCRRGDLRVTVVAPLPYAVYRPDLVLCASGRSGFVKTLRIDLVRVCRRLGVELMVDYAVGVDPCGQRVHVLAHPPIPYDVLFLATGMDRAWEAVPGLGPEHGFVCEDYAARHVAQRLAGWTGGTLLLAAGPLQQDPRQRPQLVASREGPLYELALLCAAHWARTGQPRNSRIVLITRAPVVGQELGPRGQTILSERLARAGIDTVTDAMVRQVEPHRVVAATPHGDRQWRPDLMVWTPPTAGSRLARASGLDDGWGWVATNEYLQHPKWPNIYAVGDLNRQTLPKLGHAAMVQARVAVQHWWAQASGASAPRPYRPRVVSLMYLGQGEALGTRHDLLYGGDLEQTIVGPVPYWIKQGFGRAYRFGSGALPIMP